jgi:D-aminoacyl-tRNA deacylase
LDSKRPFKYPKLLTNNPPGVEPIDRVVIVASKSDPASKNIADNMIERHRFVSTTIDDARIYRKGSIRLVMIDEICIYVKPENLPADATAIIFASKHVSSTNTPALTVHATGNLTKEAEFGGKPEELSFVDPARVRAALRTLNEKAANQGIKIDVTMEATHHGPTSFKAPTCFVEIGSGPREWVDPVLGGIAADAVMAAAVNSARVQDPSAVGFGGTHYAAKHTKANLEGGYQIGHVIPKHALESNVSDAVIRSALDRTVGSTPIALVDWKGLRSDNRQRLATLFKDWRFEMVRF